MPELSDSLKGAGLLTLLHVGSWPPCLCTGPHRRPFEFASQPQAGLGITAQGPSQGPSVSELGAGLKGHAYSLLLLALLVLLLALQAPA